jgi:hypothetical protein
MVTSVFDEIMAKHVRARSHLVALQQEINRFLKTKPYRIQIEGDDGYIEYVIRTHDVQPVPVEIPLTVGDVIHNARCVLDHLAYHLAETPNNRTYFPIHMKATDKDGHRIIPTINGGISKQIEDVLDSVQPYGTGVTDHLLGLLHQLDITDKHKLLLSTVSTFEGSAHDIREIEHGDATITYFWGTLQDGKAIARITFKEPREGFRPQFRITPCLALTSPDLGSEEGGNVVNLLWRILQHVAQTVNMFRSFV